MIHLTGNENDNPRGQVLIADIDAAVKQLCIQRMKGSGDDASFDATVGLIHTLLMAYLKPILTSMFTDTNQEVSSLSSRTNDLDVVLNIPGAK